MKQKKAPLWKWLVVVLIIVSMPMFFSFARNIQIQQALNSVAPQTDQSQQQKQNQDQS